MRQRRIYILIACLAAGAALNVTVAWACVLWSTAAMRPPLLEWKRDTAEWQRHINSLGMGGGALPTYEPWHRSLLRCASAAASPPTDAVSAWDPPMISRAHSGTGYAVVEHFWVLRAGADGTFGRTRSQLPDESRQPTRLLIVSIEGGAAGWPRPALQWRSVGPNPLPPLDDRRLSARLKAPLGSTDHLPVQLGAFQGRPLPGGPLWTGFLLNTLFYAALAGLILYGLARLRHGVRRVRRQCSACGYPIGVSPVCTECGSPCGAGATTGTAS